MNLLRFDYYQEAVINLLKSNSGVVSHVGQEIREENYMGLDWKLPAVRVAIGDCDPIGDGNCRGSDWLINFVIRVYSEKDSSAQEQVILNACAEALFSKNLSGNGFIPITPINIIRVRPHLLTGASEGNKFSLWLGEILCQQRVKVSD